jgi:hypothetical protein
MFEGLMQSSIEGNNTKPVQVPWLVWRDGLPCGKRVKATDPMSALDKAGYPLDEVDEVNPLPGGDFITGIRGKSIRILRVR